MDKKTNRLRGLSGGGDDSLFVSPGRSYSMPWAAVMMLIM